MLHRHPPLSHTLFVAALLLSAARVGAQVQHGILDVVENDNGNTPASVTVTRVGGFGPWVTVIDAGGDQTNRGDYVVDFLTGNDQNLGVLIVGPYNDARSEPNVTPSPYYATVSHARTTSGTNRYYVAVHSSPGGVEVNYNATLAYFPIADGWKTGGFYNSTNGGTITLLVAPAEIALSNPFDPNLPNYPSVLIDNANGVFDLRLANINMNRDGVLLVCSGKNEDNYALVGVRPNGNGVIVNRDNGADGSTTEQDPAAFVFIPEGTPGVTMGRITATGRVLLKQGDVTVQMIGQPTTNGTFRLTIAGESPSTGTLLACPYSELSGATVDNAVFVAPDGDGWILTTRDLPGMSLQDLSSGDIFCHFAFFKSGVPIYPVEPPRAYVPRLDDIVSARFAVTEYAPGNTNGDMRADKTIGSTALDVFGDNLGDVGIAWLGARPLAYSDNSLDAAEGVWLGNCTQFIRDNSASGGAGGWGTLSFDNGVARTHAASPFNVELNIDFALAFFPAAFGLQQDADVQVLTGSQSVVTVAGNAATDGVCLAINWDNNNRVVSTRPEGNTYIVECWNGNDGQPSSDWDYGYVYIPYNRPEGFIAGQIAADATILSGTGGFTVGLGTDDLGFDVITLAIAGVNAATDGVLLVTPTGPYAMSWEPGPGGVFEVAGMDLTTFTAGRAAFSFAWVPFDRSPNPPAAYCRGDVDCSGIVDFDDIDPLVARIGCPSADAEGCGTGCPWQNADIDEDGDVDFDDIDLFVARLGTSCS